MSALNDLVRRGLYASLTIVGVPGNILVIVAFLLLSYEENRLLAAEAIVLHLTCANLLVVVVRCLTETLASFHVVNVFGDAGCKGVIFIYRTSRALSIWLTFLLSTYQCLSISPPGSYWASVRVLLAQNLVFVFLFLWVLNTTMSSGAILFSLSSKNDSNLSKEIFGAVQVSRDVVPMALMTLTSVIILVLLYQHNQHMNDLHRNKSVGVLSVFYQKEEKKSYSIFLMCEIFFFNFFFLIQVVSLRSKKSFPSEKEKSMDTASRWMLSGSIKPDLNLFKIVSERRLSGGSN
uniref:Vomeronasal type-1 receptor n=1 Tax=Oryzias latipes TaxID=8090 RepID=A0A3P9M4X4_ORYLA